MSWVNQPAHFRARSPGMPQLRWRFSRLRKSLSACSSHEPSRAPSAGSNCCADYLLIRVIERGFFGLGPPDQLRPTPSCRSYRPPVLLLAACANTCRYGDEDYAAPLPSSAVADAGREENGRRKPDTTEQGKMEKSFLNFRSAPALQFVFVTASCSCLVKTKMSVGEAVGHCRANQRYVSG